MTAEQQFLEIEMGGDWDDVLIVGWFHRCSQRQNSIILLEYA